MFLSQDQINEREYTNSHMFEIPEEIANGYLPDYSENLLVRMFYLPVVSMTNESGLIEPKYKLGESDGGKVIASIDDYPFQRRGVILKLSKKAADEGLSVGQVVWLPNHIYNSPAYDLLYHKAAPVDKSEGYKLIPFRNVEYIESELYIQGDTDNGNNA